MILKVSRGTSTLTMQLGRENESARRHSYLFPAAMLHKENKKQNKILLQVVATEPVYYEIGKLHHPEQKANHLTDSLPAICDLRPLKNTKLNSQQKAKEALIQHLQNLRRTIS